MKKIVYSLLVTVLIILSCNRQTEKSEVEQWSVYEIMFEGPDTGNPYVEVEFAAILTNQNRSVKVPGFYDGEGKYYIRFSPSEQGRWTYKTESNINELADLHGGFICIPATGDNHGPVKITNTFYLEYADGTPFYSVGTTAYQWTSVKMGIQEKTISTLDSAPFNKIRMCVFPKHYIYGNETEPWIDPFVREDSTIDFTQPNFEFFRNFDKRIEQLLEMGIQADVILFHPYDRWGYSKMGNEMNEKYVRYMIARIAAYRNVWWSLANEWDIPGFKEIIDWEGIGEMLQREDPCQRLRGIHNWYGSEDHFYDHSRPWITHISTQTSQFYNAVKWRNKYQKPLLFDEMRYEGDVPSGWGNLSGEEMSSYFWMAGLSGGYPTHGDTYQNGADDSTEVRWWAKGGELVGESPARISYFRSIMEQSPVKSMSPDLIANGNPENLNDNVYIFSQPGAYYLVFTANSDQKIEISTIGEANYTMEVIDTWNMEITETKVIKPGLLTYQTEFPYTALRIYTAVE